MPPYPLEPFKIKVVEALKRTTPDERDARLQAAGFNMFNIDADDVFIDLLTDSGTGAMSDTQWAGIMMGDESYAGARSFKKLADVVNDVFGFKHFVPTHQGRAAEHILCAVLAKPGDTIPNNSHFDTTGANVRAMGAVPCDLLCRSCEDPQSQRPFKGDIDLDLLADFLAEHDLSKVPFGMITVTNNSNCGQPVSMANIRAAAAFYRQNNIPFFIDACRYAENCYFIKTREEGYADKSIAEIAREMFSYADGCTFSAKKDGLVNIGGLLCVNDDSLFEDVKQMTLLREGFPTYGGLAGRDLEALAVGLRDCLKEEYLKFRVGQTGYLCERLHEIGVPVARPAGGHAVFVDACRVLPHIPRNQFPGQALVVALYRFGGIRAVELGSGTSFDRPPVSDEALPSATTTTTGADHNNSTPEWVRLSLPHRVYTQGHLDFVAETFREVQARADEIRGLEVVSAPRVLPHFSAVFREV